MTNGKTLFVVLSFLVSNIRCTVANLYSEDFLKSFDYKHNGIDWPETWPDCGKSKQSPVDLRTDNHSDPFPINYDDHSYTANYVSLLKTFLKQAGTNLYIEFPDAKGNPPTSKENFFNSTWSRDNFGAKSEIFNASQIFFHSGSEHTINGKRYDLELKTIHFADDESGNIKGASMSVLFDTKAWDNYTEEEEETIDAFWDSLVLDQLEKRNPFSYEIYFSSIITLVEEKNRWVYQGSLSMPPCYNNFYVQVFHRILPIKEDYLEQIKTWQKRGSQRGQDNLQDTGNYRETNDLDGHDVRYLIAVENRETVIIKKEGSLALMAVLLVVAVALSSLICYFLCPSFKEALPDAPDLDDQGEDEDESPYADASPVPTSEQELVKQQELDQQQAQKEQDKQQ